MPRVITDLQQSLYDLGEVVMSWHLNIEVISLLGHSLGMNQSALPN